MSKYTITEEDYKKLISRIANGAIVCFAGGIAIGILIGVHPTAMGDPRSHQERPAGTGREDCAGEGA